MQNLNTTPLVPEKKILTLQGVKPGKKRISHGIINLNDFFIKYSLALLAKIGIRQWSPDLNDADDSLYNEACQISVIQTFRQLAAGGAYNHSAGQKTITADAFNVSFLPNASKSLRGAQHPDERVGDRKFTNKYWDQLIEPYNISHEIPNEEELDETYEDSEVGSSEDESYEEEEVQEVAQSNQLCNEDTPMAQAPEADYFNTGSSHLAFENKWSGW
ncbi:hypothetical protein O181_119502 [Austropuccinia psidii MF-1]|uniref:Uncharacterized protein n=1 Tax=Austropuccinia psidii MF-1 TaxID=1389203 RepID=A0A9Q3Q1G1_9BASI|nr:hypothetical protein [Austropuccinia psidii MF-1]